MNKSKRLPNLMNMQNGHLFFFHFFSPFNIHPKIHDIAQIHLNIYINMDFITKKVGKLLIRGSMPSLSF